MIRLVAGKRDGTGNGKEEKIGSDRKGEVIDLKRENREEKKRHYKAGRRKEGEKCSTNCSVILGPNERNGQIAAKVGSRQEASNEKETTLRQTHSEQGENNF